MALPGGALLWHPGLAWAWRKTALNQLGGMMDWLMGGAADHYMALALFNKLTTRPLQAGHCLQVVSGYVL